MSALSGPPRVAPYAIVFGPHANCTLEICSPQYSVYGYRPSLAANTSFIALFGLAGFIHLYLGFRWRTWWFAGCMLVGCVSAILGYVGRVMMYYNPFDFVAFMLQIICVTTTPLYFCAAIYVTLSATIIELSPSLSRFPPKLFYWIFVPCDLISLVIQAAGGGLSTKSKGESQVGVNLALAGLAFQVLTICTFCGFFFDYLYRYFRSNQLAKHSLSRRIEVFLSTLFLAIVLITVRCAFRVAELHEGYSGGLVSDEALFIGLEGVSVLRFPSYQFFTSYFLKVHR
ncbi:conserved hypothetical protein [Uncinocarpus reesii 1704]|uniref:Parasitic phase-specific protein PSP-1 n=1 Tax=Uncinocarpus reesii (strain UAMH 1704) TaxID=336963 RepID=C4JNA3_UNCRE|nr:uncharacterized protein UREG_04309 [Uncinocarpus reesii 1704]EEP79463.1 conserved hypothetical protein [Uncinocarpus reesii 1704]